MNDIMLSTVPIHPRTKKQAELFIKHPAQALLIIGQSGTGKKTVAEYIAAKLLQIKAARLDYFPYYSAVSLPDGKTEIPIDAIRDIISRAKLKVPGHTIVKKVVAIYGAEAMSHEAQNALLKILEEPPSGTLFILTAPSARSILPTIVSRSRLLTVHEVGINESEQHYSGRYDSLSVQKAWSLSGGAAQLMDSLLKDGQDHPLKNAVDEAKQLLITDLYSRLIMLDELSKDKTRFTLVLTALGRVMESLHHQYLETQPARAARMLENRKLVKRSLSQLDTNANRRLLALGLALNLKL